MTKESRKSFVSANFLFRKDNSVVALDEWVEWARWFTTNLERSAHPQLTHAHSQLSTSPSSPHHEHSAKENLLFTFKVIQPEEDFFPHLFEHSLYWYSSWSARAFSAWTMIRKLSAADLYRIAKSNEFVTDAHLKEDEVRQSEDSFTKRYLRNQNESLNLWKMSVVLCYQCSITSSHRYTDSFDTVSRLTKLKLSQNAFMKTVSYSRTYLLKTSLDDIVRHALTGSTRDQILRRFKTCWKNSSMILCAS